MATQSFAVVIASKGRPQVLADTVESLSDQTVRVDYVICVVTSPDDIDRATANRPEVATLYCPPGLTRQRNAALDQIVNRFEIIIFLDDDMQLGRTYVASALEFLRDQPGIAAFSGFLLRDGNVTRDEARQLLDSHRRDPHDYRPIFRARGRHQTLHGCNMVARSSVLKYERFDENLPLYGFAEDYDISLRISNYGLVGRLRSCIAVHLEIPSGRISEKRLGYAMLANNWYFLGKRVTHCSSLVTGYARFAVRLALFEPLANLFGTVFGQWHRIARLQGNCLALRDILLGTCSPGRINEID